MNPERLPAELHDAEGTRAIDRHAIEAGTPGYTLMTRAGEAALRVTRANWPEARHVRIYCGAGNNAGDGYVIARLALEGGLDVEVCAVTPVEKLAGDAARAAADAVAAGVQPRSLSRLSDRAPDLQIDALLGTGLARDLDGDYAAAVDAINETEAPVCALDVPSGIDADSGTVRGAAVRADVTVTFIAVKQGLLTGAATEHVGRLVLETLAIEGAALSAAGPTARLLLRRNTRIPRRGSNAHKGANGHVVIIAGDRGMGGAAHVAALGAARSGAGLVTVITRGRHGAALHAALPEVMVRNASAVSDALARADVVAVGPGLGQARWGRELWQAATATDRPMIVDADGLNLLAAMPAQRPHTTLTPHPGEAARLLDTTTADIQANRYLAAANIARRYAAVCVLKGAGTVVSADTLPAVCPYGNPGMAGGGMGDLLTGVIAALQAQGLEAREAAECGVLAHALAGDAAALQRHHVLAGDVARELPRVLRAMARNA